MKNIFITGGAGYIGSHCALSLIKNGFKPIIIDNFSNSSQKIINQLQKIVKKKIIFYNIDIRDKKKLKLVFKKLKCYAVIHCAGSKQCLKVPKNQFFILIIMSAPQYPY